MSCSSNVSPVPLTKLLPTQDHHQTTTHANMPQMLPYQNCLHTCTNIYLHCWYIWFSMCNFDTKKKYLFCIQISHTKSELLTRQKLACVCFWNGQAKTLIVISVGGGRRSNKKTRNPKKYNECLSLPSNVVRKPQQARIDRRWRIRLAARGKSQAWHKNGQPWWCLRSKTGTESESRLFPM